MRTRQKLPPNQSTQSKQAPAINAQKRPLNAGQKTGQEEGSDSKRKKISWP